MIRPSIINRSAPLYPGETEGAGQATAYARAKQWLMEAYEQGLKGEPLSGGALFAVQTLDQSKAQHPKALPGVNTFRAEYERGAEDRKMTK